MKSTISNCRFLYIGTDAELIKEVQQTFDKLNIIHFEICLYFNKAKEHIQSIIKKGLFFHFIILDKDESTHNNAVQFFEFIKTKDQKHSKIFILTPSPDDESNTPSINANIEWNDSDVTIIQRPIKTSSFISKLEEKFTTSFGNNPLFIDSIKLPKCQIYKLPFFIDEVIIREISYILKEASKIKKDLIILNFKNTVTFSKNEMKSLSQELLKAKQDWHKIYSAGFSNDLSLSVRKAGFNHVFDTKINAKELLKKYDIDISKLKKNE